MIRSRLALAILTFSLGVLIIVGLFAVFVAAAFG